MICEQNNHINKETEMIKKKIEPNRNSAAEVYNKWTYKSSKTNVVKQKKDKNKNKSVNLKTSHLKLSDKNWIHKHIQRIKLHDQVEFSLGCKGRSTYADQSVWYTTLAE